MKKKILIFTASMGSGHITASIGLHDRFIKQKYTVEIIDVLSWNIFGKMSRWIFGFLGNYFPKILEFIFHISSQSNPSWISRILSKGCIDSTKLKNIFQNTEDIESVWITFPAISLFLQKYWKQEIHVQITDYTSPHLSWIWGDNLVVHALDQESKQYINDHNATKKVVVDPFPLPQKFHEASNYSDLQKSKIREKHHFKPNEKIFLFFFHHVLLGEERELVENFLQHPEYANHTALIIAGSHQKSFAKFQNNPRVRIEQWVNAIYEYYSIASGVCGKCGGAFISEAMMFGLPLCIAGVFSGQEKGNKEFLEKYYAKNLISF